MKKYPVITLCGSTRFKTEFEQVMKRLTLQGNIVISVGLFGHAGDKEVWEGKSEGEITQTKEMLDDMHKSKIDMADSIYVINPGGYIGESTWSEICYAYMTGKRIDSLEPISEAVIKKTAEDHIELANRLAWMQSDCLESDDFPVEEEYAWIKYKSRMICNPWIPINPETDTDTFDPFKEYGQKKMARFIETILVKRKDWTEEAYHLTKKANGKIVWIG
ncbi:MAG: hypothetical protein PUG16_01460 [Lachnospiraceae bacterium]|nr:hypothetical protein [Lachnospiraceae bacterium]